MSDVLNELRDALVGEMYGCVNETGNLTGDEYIENAATRRCIACLDAFAAAHPGLVDLTRECENCHRKVARTQFIITTHGATYLKAEFCEECARTVDMLAYYGLAGKEKP